jgi:hypothetical protein
MRRTASERGIYSASLSRFGLIRFIASRQRHVKVLKGRNMTARGKASLRATPRDNAPEIILLSPRQTRRRAGDEEC